MIVLDIETTGQVPWEHSLLSLGAVEFFKPSNQFYGECRMMKGTKIDPYALKINGFSRKEITREGKKEPKELLNEFIAWTRKVDDTTIAGLNHYMDVYFIEYALKFYKMKNPFSFRLVDLHTIAYVDYLKNKIKLPLKDGGSILKSTLIYEYCGLPSEPFPHNALTGAKMEAEAISRIVYGRNLLKEYSKFKIPRRLTNK